MKAIRKLVLSFVAVAALVVGSTTTAPPATAADSYNTVNDGYCGVSLFYGPYCGVTWNKTNSENMKSKLAAGESIAAIATWACGKVPNLIAEAACVLWFTYNTYDARTAINDAHQHATRCVALRWYSTSLGQFAKHISSLTCSSATGGGGGGGGSWRS